MINTPAIFRTPNVAFHFKIGADIVPVRVVTRAHLVRSLIFQFKNAKDRDNFEAKLKSLFNFQVERSEQPGDYLAAITLDMNQKDQDGLKLRVLRLILEHYPLYVVRK